MKKTLLSIVVLLTMNLIFSQEIVITTDGIPPLFFDIQSTDDYLYLPGFDKSLYRASYSNLQDYNPISSFDSNGDIFRCTYDKNENVIYLLTLSTELISIDLNESIPISANIIGQTGLVGGMTIANNELIMAGPNNNLWKVNKTNANLTSLYTDPSGVIRNPEYSNGTYYFQVYELPYNKLIKLEIDGDNVNREEIYSFEGNTFVQSSTIENEILYLGVESGLIFEFDLTETTYPLSPEIYNFQDREVLGITYNDNNLYFSVNNTFVYRVENAVLNTTETKSELMTIYPNPVFDFLHVKNNDIRNLEYEVYDITGKSILNGVFNDRINFSLLNDGIYFLKLLSENDTQTVKIIKD